MAKINVAVECNTEHRASVYALVTSIVTNKREKSRYCIYMLLEGSDKSNWEEILSFAGETVEIIFVDKSVNELTGLGKLILLKWNTLVMGDLSELYSMELEGKSFAATANIPCKEYVIPDCTEEYNPSVLVLDTDKLQNTVEYKQMSVFYNYGYGEAVGMGDYALILHADCNISPEKYFDSPLAQVWIKYYKSSPIGKEILKREAYAETIGETGEKNEQSIPVLLCVEDSNVVHAIVLISSIEEKLAKDRTLDVRLVYHQLSLEHKKMLMELSSQRVNIVLYNIQKYLLNKKRTCKEILASSVFTDYDKAICLDTKIVVEDDISKIYDLNIEDYFIRAIHEKCLTEENSSLTGVGEFATSVTMINVNRWIANDINEQVQKLLDSAGYKKYSEKDILNMICMKQRAFICDQFEIYTCNEKEEQYLELVETYISNSPWREKLAKDKMFYETREDENVKEVLVEIQKLKADNKQLQKANGKLKAENAKLSKQNERLYAERERFLYEILEIRKSVTYKIGRAFTLIPRKLRGDK